ncbi:DUF6491 family protein [Maricaulis parjimensis]|uniref:DUF6491 family protein n=1 Tax=Maricaulis parjimensis TaxID=144023 RepID=UPI00193A2F3E|nr:DUF6491 family protein [Maricaulis parjimensis]
MKHLISSALVAASLSGLTACASTATETSAPVRLVNVNGYNVLDREHVLLNGGASRHYLVTLRRRCPGLNFGIELATSFPATTTLHYPMNEYITLDDGMRCFIDTVEEVESADAARALIAERAEAEDSAE